MRTVTLSRRPAVIVALAALAACGGRTVAVAPAPAAPEQTLAAFLAAVNANDLDRMALLWGSERGPSTVSSPNTPDVRHQQLVIMQRLLVADSFRVIGAEAVPGQRAQRLQVLMMRGPRRATVPFTMVTARTGGWLIREIGLDLAMPLSQLGS